MTLKKLYVDAENRIKQEMLLDVSIVKNFCWQIKIKLNRFIFRESKKKFSNDDVATDRNKIFFVKETNICANSWSRKLTRRNMFSS